MCSHMVPGPSAQTSVETEWGFTKWKSAAMLPSPTSDLGDWRIQILGFRHGAV